MKALRLKTIDKDLDSHSNQNQHIPKYIASANEIEANRIGSLLIRVFHSAKCLTESGNSFPGRVVVDKMAASFTMESPLCEVSSDSL